MIESETEFELTKNLEIAKIMNLRDSSSAPGVPGDENGVHENQHLYVLQIQHILSKFI